MAYLFVIPWKDGMQTDDLVEQLFNQLLILHFLQLCVRGVLLQRWNKTLLEDVAGIVRWEILITSSNL
jgi:hypothetical protein